MNRKAEDEKEEEEVAMDYVNQLISRSSIVAREEAANEEDQSGITASS